MPLFNFRYFQVLFTSLVVFIPSVATEYLVPCTPGNLNPYSPISQKMLHIYIKVYTDLLLNTTCNKMLWLCHVMSARVHHIV
jgi:hypothetical protein